MQGECELAISVRALVAKVRLAGDPKHSLRSGKGSWAGPAGPKNTQPLP